LPGSRHADQKELNWQPAAGSRAPTQQFGPSAVPDNRGAEWCISAEQIRQGDSLGATRPVIWKENGQGVHG